MKGSLFFVVVLGQFLYECRVFLERHSQLPRRPGTSTPSLGGKTPRNNRETPSVAATYFRPLACLTALLDCVLGLLPGFLLDCLFDCVLD